MVVKRLRTRPALIMRTASDSSAWVLKEQGKSLSMSSLRSDGMRSYHKRSSSISRDVCFAQHAELCDYAPLTPEPLTEVECKRCFYSSDDIARFDRDRSLTILMYRTRKNNGVVWDDNVHSLRGLEEMISKPGDKSRASKRKDHKLAVLSEQTRLRDPKIKNEVASAAVIVKKSQKDLCAELIRGVSCSHSKTDRQRSLGYGQRDERFACRGSSSTRNLLEKLRTKFNGWASASNRSLHVSDRESLSGDDADS